MSIVRLDAEAGEGTEKKKIKTNVLIHNHSFLDLVVAFILQFILFILIFQSLLLGVRVKISGQKQNQFCLLAPLKPPPLQQNVRFLTLANQTLSLPSGFSMQKKNDTQKFCRKTACTTYKLRTLKSDLGCSCPQMHLKSVCLGMGVDNCLDTSRIYLCTGGEKSQPH